MGAAASNSTINPFEQMDPISKQYESEAIRRLTSLLDSFPKNDPGRGPIHFLLAVFNEKRYRRTRDPRDFSRWIDGVSESERFEHNLGEGMFTKFRALFLLLGPLSQFKKKQKLEDLNNIMDMAAEEIYSGQAACKDDSFRTELMAFKARFLNLRFSRTAEENDLDEIIKLLNHTIGFTADCPSRTALLDNVGIALQLKIDLFPTSENQILLDLNAAVSSFHECLTKTPIEDPLRPLRLAHFSNTVSKRFVQTRSETDLRNAIDAMTEALELAAPRNSKKETLIATLKSTNFDCIELVDGPGTEAALDALEKSIDVVRNHVEVWEDWPIQPDSPRSEKRKNSGSDVSDVIKILQAALDAHRPSGEDMTKILGLVLGYEASDPSTPISGKEQTRDPKRRAISPPTPQEPRRPVGTTGIANMGNTCYMNSALQCIVHCEPLTEYFRKNQYKSDLNRSNRAGLNGRLAESYAKLISSLFSESAGKAIEPLSFKRVFAEFNSEFSGYDQKDSLEFLTSLMSGIHEDLNRIKKKHYMERDLTFGDNPTQDQQEIWGLEAWEAHKMRNDSVVVDNLHGLFKSTTVCGQCHGVAVTFDAFADITVPLPLREILQTISVIYVPSVGTLCHMFVQVPKIATIGYLLNIVGVRMNTDPFVLVSAEQNYEFFKHHRNDTRISEVIYNRVFVHQLPELVDYQNSIVLPVIHKRKVVYNGRVDFKSFGVPFYIVLTGDERRDFKKIYEKIRCRYSQFSDAMVFHPEFTQTIAHDGLFTIRLQGPRLIGSKRHVDMPTQFQRPDNLRDLEKYLSPIMASSPSPGIGTGGIDGHDENILKFGTHPQSTDGVQHSHGIHNSYTADIFDFIPSSDLTPSESGSTVPKDIITGDIRIPEVQFGEGLIALWSDPTIYEQIHGDRNITHWDRCDSWIDPRGHNTSELDNPLLTLSNCFDEFSSIEKLDGEQAWFCPRCEMIVPAETNLTLWRVPQILIIQLKRFDPARNRKVDTFIKFPVTDLDLTDRVGDKGWLKMVSNGQPLMYDLFAVANHSGGLNGGHWTADVHNYVDGKWYSFNDSFVSPLKAKSVVNPSALLLFYKRRSANSSEIESLEVTV